MSRPVSFAKAKEKRDADRAERKAEHERQMSEASLASSSGRISDRPRGLSSRGSTTRVVKPQPTGKHPLKVPRRRVRVYRVI